MRGVSCNYQRNKIISKLFVILSQGDNSIPQKADASHVEKPWTTTTIWNIPISILVSPQHKEEEEKSDRPSSSSSKQVVDGQKRRKREEEKYPIPSPNFINISPHAERNKEKTSPTSQEPDNGDTFFGISTTSETRGT